MEMKDSLSRKDEISTFYPKGKEDTHEVSSENAF